MGKTEIGLLTQQITNNLRPPSAKCVCPYCQNCFRHPGCSVAMVWFETSPEAAWNSAIISDGILQGVFVGTHVVLGGCKRVLENRSPLHGYIFLSAGHAHPPGIRNSRFLQSGVRNNFHVSLAASFCEDNRLVISNQIVLYDCHPAFKSIPESVEPLGLSLQFWTSISNVMQFDHIMHSRSTFLHE